MKKISYILLLFCFCATAQQTAVDSMLVVLKKSKSNLENDKTLNAIADTYKTSDPNLMLTFGNMALKLSKKINNKQEMGNAYHHLGNANIILGNYAVALDYFSKEQEVFENLLAQTTTLDKTDWQEPMAV